MKKKKQEKEPNHERWLLTYSDLITLLMIFFIVMYSMSNMDKNKYQKLAVGLNKAFGGSGGKNIIGVDKGASLPIDDSWKPANETIVESDEKGNGQGTGTEENKLFQVKEQVEKYLKENGLTTNVTIKIEERGLLLSFKDAMFFDSGKATVREEQTKKLIDIGKILNYKELNDNYIRVEGHTDTVPINTYQFSSNWDLSVIRATKVSELLIKGAGIRPERVAALGYGEYRPVDTNNTEEGRAKNRRVDIIIMSSKYNEVENNKK